jgi:hypothetical protein
MLPHFLPCLACATFVKSPTNASASLKTKLAFHALLCGLLPHRVGQKLPSFTFLMKLSYSLTHRFFERRAPLLYTHEF